MEDTVKKVLLFALAILIGTNAYAFGGGGSGRSSKRYEYGVNSFGIYRGGDKQVDIEFRECDSETETLVERTCCPNSLVYIENDAKKCCNQEGYMLKNGSCEPMNATVSLTQDGDNFIFRWSQPGYVNGRITENAAGSWILYYNATARSSEVHDFTTDSNGNLKETIWYPESLEEIENAPLKDGKVTSFLKDLFGIKKVMAALTYSCPSGSGYGYLDGHICGGCTGGTDNNGRCGFNTDEWLKISDADKCVMERGSWRFCTCGGTLAKVNGQWTCSCPDGGTGGWLGTGSTCCKDGYGYDGGSYSLVDRMTIQTCGCPSGYTKLENDNVCCAPDNSSIGGSTGPEAHDLRCECAAEGKTLVSYNTAGWLGGDWKMACCPTGTSVVDPAGNCCAQNEQLFWKNGKIQCDACAGGVSADWMDGYEFKGAVCCPAGSSYVTDYNGNCCVNGTKNENGRIICLGECGEDEVKVGDDCWKTCPASSVFVAPFCCRDGYGAQYNTSNKTWGEFNEQNVVQCVPATRTEWYERNNQLVYDFIVYYPEAKDTWMAGSWKVVYDINTKKLTAMDYYRAANGELKTVVWYPKNLKEVEETPVKNGANSALLKWLKGVFEVKSAMAADSCIREGTCDDENWDDYEDMVDCYEDGGEWKDGSCNLNDGNCPNGFYEKEGECCTKSSHPDGSGFMLDARTGELTFAPNICGCPPHTHPAGYGYSFCCLDEIEGAAYNPKMKDGWEAHPACGCLRGTTTDGRYCCDDHYVVNDDSDGEYTDTVDAEACGCPNGGTPTENVNGKWVCCKDGKGLSSREKGKDFYTEVVPPCGCPSNADMVGDVCCLQDKNMATSDGSDEFFALACGCPTLEGIEGMVSSDGSTCCGTNGKRIRQDDFGDYSYSEENVVSCMNECPTVNGVTGEIKQTNLWDVCCGSNGMMLSVSGEYDMVHPVCGCPKGSDGLSGTPSEDNRSCCKNNLAWNGEDYKIMNTSCGCPLTQSGKEGRIDGDGDVCCDPDTNYSYDSGTSKYNGIDAYCGCPYSEYYQKEGVASGHSCCLYGFGWGDGDYNAVDPNCGCPTTPDGAEGEITQGKCCWNGYTYDDKNSFDYVIPSAECGCPQDISDLSIPEGGDIWFSTGKFCCSKSTKYAYNTVSGQWNLLKPAECGCPNGRYVGDGYCCTNTNYAYSEYEGNHVDIGLCGCPSTDKVVTKSSGETLCCDSTTKLAYSEFNVPEIFDLDCGCPVIDGVASQLKTGTKLSKDGKEITLQYCCADGYAVRRVDYEGNADGGGVEWVFAPDICGCPDDGHWVEDDNNKLICCRDGKELGFNSDGSVSDYTIENDLCKEEEPCESPMTWDSEQHRCMCPGGIEPTEKDGVKYCCNKGYAYDETACSNWAGSNGGQGYCLANLAACGCPDGTTEQGSGCCIGGYYDDGTQARLGNGKYTWSFGANNVSECHACGYGTYVTTDEGEYCCANNGADISSCNGNIYEGDNSCHAGKNYTAVCCEAMNVNSQDCCTAMGGTWENSTGDGICCSSTKAGYLIDGITKDYEHCGCPGGGEYHENNNGEGHCYNADGYELDEDCSCASADWSCWQSCYTEFDPYYECPTGYSDYYDNDGKLVCCSNSEPGNDFYGNANYAVCGCPVDGNGNQGEYTNASCCWNGFEWDGAAYETLNTAVCGCPNGGKFGKDGVTCCSEGYAYDETACSNWSGPNGGNGYCLANLAACGCPDGTTEQGSGCCIGGYYDNGTQARLGNGKYTWSFGGNKVSACHGCGYGTYVTKDGGEYCCTGDGADISDIVCASSDSCNHNTNYTAICCEAMNGNSEYCCNLKGGIWEDGSCRM